MRTLQILLCVSFFAVAVSGWSQQPDSNRSNTDGAPGGSATPDQAGDQAGDQAEQGMQQSSDRSAADDRNARWRFKKHQGQWWYWHPDEYWMIHEQGRWTKWDSQRRRWSDVAAGDAMRQRGNQGQPIYQGQTYQGQTYRAQPMPQARQYGQDNRLYQPWNNQTWNNQPWSDNGRYQSGYRGPDTYYGGPVYDRFGNRIGTGYGVPNQPYYYGNPGGRIGAGVGGAVGGALGGNRGAAIGEAVGGALGFERN